MIFLKNNKKFKKSATQARHKPTMIKGDDKAGEQIKITSKVVKNRNFVKFNIFDLKRRDDLMDQEWRSTTEVTSLT